jgi:hypothetical protein
MRSRSDTSQVRVLIREKVLVRVLTPDSSVAAELRNSGVDPAGFENKVKAELEYRFIQKRHEAVQDSASADVILTLRVKSFAPEATGSRINAVLVLRSERGDAHQQEEWTWRTSQGKMAGGFRGEYFTRAMADEVMTHVRTAKQYEPVPQLIMFN